MSQGRIAVLVSNDLEFDQRVRKTCHSLTKAGWEPLLIGRRWKRSDARSIDRPYPSFRMWLGVQSGPVFYLLLQLGMLRALRRCHREGGVKAVWANDLDTLWPAIWAARRWGWKVAYDSHEWFTEAEGLKGRPLRKALWLWWERRCFRHLECMLTVNGAIADAYRSRYGLKVEVVPNVSERSEPAEPMLRSDLGWPEDRKVLLMQGAFMDRDRGALDAVRALVHLPDCHLALIGSGPEFDAAAKVAERLGVRSRLHLHDRKPFEVLRRCTAAADVGLSLDRPTVENFRFSLPNKLFDYLHAGLPVVCSDLPVAGKFVKEEAIGEVASAAEGDEAIARSVADAVGKLVATPPTQAHLAQVASRHHWGSYETKLRNALHPLRALG
jgi:glycosyltransferase involved in cell wall biosynthesis